jgi:hypothetical protein
MHEFIAATTSADLEAVCHFIFGRAHTKWSDHGSAALSVGERTVIAVETFVGETCNGGLIQYLGNESGAFAKDLPEALMRVGLVEFVPIALEMKKLFGAPLAEDSGERWEQLEEVDETALDQLSDKFFDLLDVERFRECLTGFIRRNPLDFVADNGG